MERIDKALLMSKSSFYDVVIIDEHFPYMDSFIKQTLRINPVQRFFGAG